MSEVKRYGDNNQTPELMADLADNVAKVLLEQLEISQDEAKSIGIEVANTISFNWGGINIYIPMGFYLHLSNRDLKIYREFDGTNCRELSKKYKLSMQRIYRIIKKVREEEFKRRQMSFIDGFDD